MAKDYREIGSIVARLGFDTSVFKQLEKGIKLGLIAEDKYTHILEKIYISSSKSNIRTKDMAVQRLLLQLTKLVHNDLKSENSGGIDYTKIREIMAQNQQPAQPQDNTQLMELLGSMAQKLDALEKKENIVVQKVMQSNISDSDLEKNIDINISMEPVFIDPLDKDKLSKIKSNVKIESKEDSNISNKLSRLKKLKEGK